MKKYLAVAVASMSSLIGVAYAVPPGFYAGVHAGYSFDQTDTSYAVTDGTYFLTTSVDAINAAPALDLSDDAFVGGAQVGYLAMASGWGYGIEADISYMNANGADGNSVVYPCCGPTAFVYSAAVDTDYLATVRARAGVDFAGSFLYVTGGLAISDASFSVSSSDTLGPIPLATYSASDTLIGWTAGGGLEFDLSANVSAKAEYLYVDLGSIGASGLFAAGFTDVAGGTADITKHVARIGVNLHF